MLHTFSKGCQPSHFSSFLWFLLERLIFFVSFLSLILEGWLEREEYSCWPLSGVQSYRLEIVLPYPFFCSSMARKTAAHRTTLDVRKGLASILVSAISCWIPCDKPLLLKHTNSWVSWTLQTGGENKLVFWVILVLGCWSYRLTKYFKH